VNVATFLLRLELPDRPGALGAVASRIGAVRGDVVAVEIVERRQGSAVDEFVVDLADVERLELLLSEVAEVDGVSVEEVHPVSGRGHDRRLDGYHSAVALLQQRTPHAVLVALASRVSAELDAEWTAVLDVEQLLVVASAGRPPAAPWLAAFVTEDRATSAHGGDAGDTDRPVRPRSGDIGWVDLAAWDLVLATGRPGWRFGARERAHLAAVAALADVRWVDLGEREARNAHPTCTG